MVHSVINNSIIVLTIDQIGSLSGEIATASKVGSSMVKDRFANIQVFIHIVTHIQQIHIV